MEKVIDWYTIYYNYGKIKQIDLVFLPDISKIANFVCYRHYKKY